jgi:glucokinase
MTVTHYICLDIGGTNIRAALFPSRGIKPIEHIRIPTQGNNQLVEERILDLIESIRPKKGSITAIGAAAAGYIDSKNGKVLSAVNIPGWVNVPLVKIINKRFNTPVIIANDARMAALGEWHFGAARGHHHVIYLTISTGIGGGVIINDQLLLGSFGLATELGHVTILPDGPICVCGQKGHLEALCSGTGIANFVKGKMAGGVKSTLFGRTTITAKDIAEEASKGDALSQEAFERAGYYLGIAIANLLHTFNPTCIVLGGGVSQTGNILLNPVKASLKQHLLNPEYIKNLNIAIAQLGDDAGLIGALAMLKVAKY